MATNAKAVVTVDPADSKRKRMRSPAYPFINLETALRRAKEFYDIEVRNAVSLKTTVKHWNFNEKSSGGLQTVATLISFGLMKDEGSGDKRKLQLTQEALRILLDQRPESTEKAALIKKAALAPKIHQELWKRWGNATPSELELRHALTVEWEPPFNEKSVDSFIREYKDTISFAKLSESDKLPSEVRSSDDHQDGKYVPKVGDFVQWESAGVLQFPHPKMVAGISSDGAFAFVEGSSTGLPTDELKKEDVTLHFSYKLPDQSSKTNVQEDVFSLTEGRVVIQWPSPLSAESVQDLKDWLKIVERKITRSTQSSEDQSK